MTALIRRLPGRDVLVALVVLLVVYGLAGALTTYQVYVATIVVIFTIIGASHTVLFGAAGQPSVGHAALLGAGVYSAVAVAAHTPWGMEGEIAVGIVVGGLIGVVIGLPSLRIGSLYLAIATLALCVVAQQLYFEWSALTGGGAGIQIAAPTLFGSTYTPLGLLYIALALTGLCLLFARNLLRGKQGRAWNALRTSPLAASSLGMSLGWQKVGAFGVSGAMVGCAGVLYAHAVNYVSPQDFTVDLSIITLVIAIIGGQRYLWGAALGSIFVEGVPEVLRAAGEFRYIIFGGVFVLIMLFFPEGFAGGIVALWRRFGPGRRRAVPAAVECSRPRRLSRPSWRAPPPTPHPGLPTAGSDSPSPTSGWRSAASRPSTGCRWTSWQARWSGWSARTVLARPPCSTRSPGSRRSSMARSRSTATHCAPAARRSAAGSASAARSRTSVCTRGSPSSTTS